MSSSSFKIKSLLIFQMLLILVNGSFVIYFIISMLRFYNPMTAFDVVPIISKIRIFVIITGLIIEFLLIVSKRKELWTRKFILPYMWFTGMSVAGAYLVLATLLMISYYSPSLVSKSEIIDFAKSWVALIDLTLFVIGSCFFILAYKSAIISQSQRKIANESTGLLDEFSNKQ